MAACLGSARRPAGQDFAYSDPGAHLVAAVLARATGRPVLDYARDKLFGPLGVDTDPAAQPSFTPAGLDGVRREPISPGRSTRRGPHRVRSPQAAPAGHGRPGQPVPARRDARRRRGSSREGWTLDATSHARDGPRARRRVRLPVVGGREPTARRRTAPSASAASWSRSSPDRDLVVVVSTDVGLARHGRPRPADLSRRQRHRPGVRRLSRVRGGSPRTGLRAPARISSRGGGRRGRPRRRPGRPAPGSSSRAPGSSRPGRRGCRSRR